MSSRDRNPNRKLWVSGYSLCSTGRIFRVQLRAFLKSVLTVLEYGKRNNRQRSL